MKATVKPVKRHATSQQIKHMLGERKELLAQLLKMSELTHHGHDEPDAGLLEEFCELVVDYIAAGHFGLYQRIAEGIERRQEVLEVARKVYPKIEQSTQVALTFCEKYKIDGRHDRPDKLQRDLSELGESLTMRIDLEDQLIAVMLDGKQNALLH